MASGFSIDATNSSILVNNYQPRFPKKMAGILEILFIHKHTHTLPPNKQDDSYYW